MKPNFEITSKQEALEVSGGIREELKKFSPLKICFWNREPIGRLGNSYVVAKAEFIKKQSPWPMEKDLEFSLIDDDSYYPWYEDEYEKFNLDYADLRNWVRVNDLEDMKACLRDKLLHYVIFKGERIGLIAAERSSFIGNPGFYFHEILVTKENRRKGFAQSMQRKYVSQFADQSEYVWGTIYSGNHASFKTANSNNRKKVRYECFVDYEL